MARRENINWTLPESGPISYDGAALAVLMDLRDELRTIRRILECPNFQAIPFDLGRLVKQTARRSRRNGKGV